MMMLEAVHQDEPILQIGVGSQKEKKSSNVWSTIFRSVPFEFV